MKPRLSALLQAALGLLLWTQILPAPAAAQVPQIINYQGRISVGTNAFSGTGQFRFALVNGDGAVSYWSNDGTSTAGGAPTAAVALPVVNGLYVVPLGDTSVSGMLAVPASVFANGDVRLRVWFNDGTTGSQLLTPDQRITSVGYAMVAGAVANGGVTAAQLAPNLTLGGTTTGTFSGALAGNASTATMATTATTATFALSAGSATTAGTANSATSFTGPLAGEVTGTQGATTVASVAGTGAATVRDGALLANAATDANTPGALVKRDAGGNFSAGTITATAFAGNGAGLTSLPGGFSWVTVAGISQQAASNTGYLVTAAAQSTITLPPSPAIGDIVRVTGVGAGGWKIGQNSGQSVQVRSPNTATVSQLTSATNINYSCAASSADGTKLVVSISSGYIFTSADSGITWVNYGQSSTRNWHGVASSADGSKLVGVVSGGQIYTSTDSGASWSARESARTWYSVASSADGSKLVAVVYGGQIYTSTDSGVTWLPRDSARSWQSVASSADGSKLVAVVYGLGGGQIYTSTDSGVTWVPRDSTRNWQFVASSTDGSKLVAAVYGGQIYTSADFGVTWTPRESARNWIAVASSAEGWQLVAAANGGQVYTSSDAGVTWSSHDISRGWLCLASSADGTRAFGGVYGTGGGIFHIDVTGVVNFTNPIIGPQFGAIELQYVGAGRFITLSSAGSFTSN